MKNIKTNILVHGDQFTEATSALIDRQDDWSATFNNSAENTINDMKKGVFNALVLRSISREKLTENEIKIKTIAEELRIPFVLFILEEQLFKNIKKSGLAKENIVYSENLDLNIEVLLKKIEAIIHK